MSNTKTYEETLKEMVISGSSLVNLVSNMRAEFEYQQSLDHNSEWWDKDNWEHIDELSKSAEKAEERYLTAVHKFYRGVPEFLKDV